MQLICKASRAEGFPFAFCPLPSAVYLTSSSASLVFSQLFLN
jgi:hypothetical protein